MTLSAGQPARALDVIVEIGAQIAVLNANTSINVRNSPFGAVGNGTTIDSVALQAAADAIPASGGTVFLPRGIYLQDRPLFLKSRTRLVGEGVGTRLLASVAWQTGGTYTCMITNKDRDPSFNAVSIVNVDISVENLFCDYGDFAKLPGALSGKHCVQMLGVQNVQVVDCKFDAGTATIDGVFHAEDAVAFLGCHDSIIDRCHAYNFANCSYDHWCRPINARVSNCYAESPGSAQMVNFNPEFTIDNLTDAINVTAVADGFVLADNVFISTGAVPQPLQLEPLGPGAISRNISVTGNIFKNVYLVCRRGTKSLTATGNVFQGVLGGACAVDCYGLDGSTPDGINLTGNVFVDCATTAGQGGVIRVHANRSTVAGNVVQGTAHYSCLSTSTFAVAVSGNNFVQTGTSGVPIVGSARYRISETREQLAVVAAGTTQGTATVLTDADVVYLFAGTGGVSLTPSGIAGRRTTIFNGIPGVTASVYPQSGGIIYGLSTNQPVTMASGTMRQVMELPSSGWAVV